MSEGNGSSRFVAPSKILHLRRVTRPPPAHPPEPELLELPDDCDEPHDVLAPDVPGSGTGEPKPKSAPVASPAPPVEDHPHVPPVGGGGGEPVPSVNTPSVNTPCAEGSSAEASTSHVGESLLAGIAHKLLDAIAHPQFPTTPAAQYETLAQARLYWPRFPKAAQAALRHAISTSLTLDPARTLYLLTATSESAQRAALGWSRTSVRWNPDERVYPTGGWLGEYCDYAGVGEGHRGFHFWASVAVLATAMRRSFPLTHGGDSHRPLHPNLYVLLEGPSGSGKSTAIARAKDMLMRMNERVGELDPARWQGAEWVPVLDDDRTTLEWLVKELKDSERDFARTPDPMRRVLAPEAADIVGERGIVALLVSEEMTTLLGRSVKGGDRLLAGLTRLYDGGYRGGTMVRQREEVRGVSLTCLFGSTMEWLRSEMTDQVFKGGFMGARCLLVSKSKTGREYPREPICDPVGRETLAGSLMEVALRRTTPLAFSPDADEWFREWYHGRRVRESDDPRLDAYLERQDIHLTKLAMVLTVSYARDPWITAETFEEAARIQTHEQEGMVRALRLLGGSKAGDDMQRLKQFIHNCGGRAPQSRIVQAMKHTVGKSKDIVDLLVTLEMAKEVRRAVTHSKGTKGAPRTDWVLVADELENTGDEGDGEGGDDGAGT